MKNSDSRDNKPTDEEREIADVIAPRDDHWESIDVLSMVLSAAYVHGARLKFYDLELYHVGWSGGPNVWEIHRSSSRAPVEVVNCGAFRSASELKEFLLLFVRERR